MARRGGRDSYRPRRVKSAASVTSDATVAYEQAMPVVLPAVGVPSWAAVGAIVDYKPPGWPASPLIRGARITVAPFLLKGHGWVVHIDKARGWVALRELNSVKGGCGG